MENDGNGFANNYCRCPITVTVRSPIFFPGKELRISCWETDTVGELKEEIQNKWGVYVRDVIMLHRPPATAEEEKTVMEDDGAALSAYSVADGVVVVASFERDGGCGYERLKNSSRRRK